MSSKAGSSAAGSWQVVQTAEKTAGAAAVKAYPQGGSYKSHRHEPSLLSEGHRQGAPEQKQAGRNMLAEVRHQANSARKQ